MDGLVVGVEHLRFVVDAQTAERECDTASHGITLKGGRIDGVRPVAFVNGQTRCTPPILYVRIKRHVNAHGFVPFTNSLEEFGRVHPIEPLCKLLDGVRRHPGDLPDPVFVTLLVFYLLVENLPSKLARLL